MTRHRPLPFCIITAWFLSTILPSTDAFSILPPSFVTSRYVIQSRLADLRPLNVVADAEEISKNRFLRKDRGDNNPDDPIDARKFEDAWIPTASGGFLPNFTRRTQKLANTFTRHKPVSVQTSDFHRTNNTNTIDRPIILNSVSQGQEIAKTLPKVHEVLSIQDYKKVVVDEKKSIVVVRFYASWCRACKAISLRFRQQLPQKFPNVKFVEVPLTKENAFLHQGLGVPSLPYAHIYHPEVGLVEERKINQRVFSDFVDVLQTYQQGYCEIKESTDECVSSSLQTLKP
jgi:thiol-disulfide isomerase/thioredoxin